jgi:pimeloyl-ACP methyl ester carboxylesterase
VTKLILLEPMFMRGLKLVNDPTLPPAVEFFEAYVKRVDSGEPDAVGLMIDYWFGKGAFTRLPDPVRGYLNTNAPRNALDVRSSFAVDMTAQQLGALALPVLMVWGDRSPEVIPAMGRALMKLVPGARMEAIAGGNHGMLDFHPEAVAKHIAA